MTTLSKPISYQQEDKDRNLTVIAHLWEKNGQRIVYFSTPIEGKPTAFKRRQSAINSYDLNKKAWREAPPRGSNLIAAIEVEFADLLEMIEPYELPAAERYREPADADEQYRDIMQQWRAFSDATPVGKEWRALPLEEKTAWLTRTFTEATRWAVDWAGGYLDAEEFFVYVDTGNDEWLYSLPYKAIVMVQEARWAYQGLDLAQLAAV